MSASAAVGPPTTTHRRSLWARISSPQLAPYIFISPFYVLYAVFGLFPIAYAIFLGFTKWSANGSQWVGLRNYQLVLQNPTVHKAFLNALWYVVVNDTVQIVAAIFIAVVLQQFPIDWLRSVLRSAYYVPNIVSGVTAGILFIVFLGQGGLVNALLGYQVPWLLSTEWSKPAVVANGAWRWIGYWMVMFLAGLQGIPEEYYDAAAIDGANAWQRFVHVTFPVMRPVTLFVLVMNTIGTLQIFAEPYVMFGAGAPGGPMDSATTPVLEMFKYAFIQFNLGQGAALGWLLAIVIVVFTLFQMDLTRRMGWSE